MSQSNAIRVLVCASGSGGHLFPARYVIEALKHQGASVTFVGAGARLEEEIIGPTGVECFALQSEKIKGQGPAGLLRFALSIPKAFLQVHSLFQKLKPQVVIGVGGYATFWPITYAALRRIPGWIHEAEMKPGLANYVLSHYATKISTAFPEVDLKCKSKLVYTGQPVREELQEFNGKTHEVRIPSKILVLGGSQGAHSLDKAFEGLGKFLKLHGLSVWHQCRPENYDRLLKFYSELGVVYKLMPFINDLAEAYRWCDIIVSRSGAGAVMEISIVGKPCIFVPYPHAQANHQARNAEVLVKQGKALLIEEGEEFEKRLRDGLFELLDRENYKRIAEMKLEGRPTDAAEAIAQGALKLVTSSRKPR